MNYFIEKNSLENNQNTTELASQITESLVENPTEKNEEHITAEKIEEKSNAENVSENITIEKVEEICESSNIRPKLSIRVNTLKTTKQELQQKLEQKGIEVEERNFKRFFNFE